MATAPVAMITERAECHSFPNSNPEGAARHELDFFHVLFQDFGAEPLRLLAHAVHEFRVR